MLYAVSPDGKSVAVVTRKDGIDGICLVSLKSGKKIMTRRGPDHLATTTDVAGNQWKNVGLLCWSGPADPIGNQAMALIKPSGRVIMSGDPASPMAFRMHSDGFPGDDFFVFRKDKQCADGRNEREGRGLGINSAAVYRDGSLIAVGGCNGSLRVINTYGYRWRLLGTGSHRWTTLLQQCFAARGQGIFSNTSWKRVGRILH